MLEFYNEWQKLEIKSKCYLVVGGVKKTTVLNTSAKGRNLCDGLKHT